MRRPGPAGRLQAGGADSAAAGLGAVQIAAGPRNAGALLAAGEACAGRPLPSVHAENRLQSIKAVLVAALG
jgi:hypothetical protein